MVKIQIIQLYLTENIKGLQKMVKIQIIKLYITKKKF